MGCGYEFICKTCKKVYYLGYGCYGTWIIENTIKEFKNKVKERIKNGHKQPLILDKNRNALTCLKEHIGHDYMFVNEDICGEDYQGNLVDDYNQIVIENYSSYEQINMEEPNEYF